MIIDLYDAELLGMDTGIVVQIDGQNVQHLFCSMEEAVEKVKEDYLGFAVITHEVEEE